MVRQAEAEQIDMATVSAEPTRRARFLALIDQYGPALRRLTGAYSPVAADADDLFQEISLALWEALPRFRVEASERTWLYRIAHNVALTTSTKRRRRERTELALPDASEPPATGRGTEGDLLADERRRLLVEAIQQLPLSDRQLVLLHLEGLSAAEIEEITGITAGAVATRLSRTRDRLAAELRRMGARP